MIDMGSVHILDTVSKTIPGNRLGPAELLDALRTMMRIRQFELQAKELFLKGVIKGCLLYTSPSPRD